MRRPLILLCVILLVGLVTSCQLPEGQPLLYQGQISAQVSDAALSHPDSLPRGLVVYLIDDQAAAAEELATPARLKEALNAQTVSAWDDVVTLDNASPLAALVIHDSAWPLVDGDWLAQAYRRGVVVAVFSVYAPELTAMLGDPCLAQDGFASEPYPGAFYVIASRLLLGEPDDVALIEAANPCGGDSVAGVEHPTSFSRSGASNALTDSSDFDTFVQIPTSKIAAVQEARLDFER